MRQAWLLFRLTTWRHWKAEKGVTLLLVLLLATGVGTYFSIRLANRAAVGGFERFHGAVQPESAGIIRASGGVLPVSRLLEIREVFGNLTVQLAPVLETTAIVPPQSSDEQGPSDTLRLIGLDLLQMAGLGDSFLAELQSSFDVEAGGWGDLLEAPDAIWIAPQRATLLGLNPGDTVSLILGGEATEWTFRGVLPQATSRGEIPDNLLLVDLPDLQRALGGEPRIDRVEVLTSGSAPDALPIDALRPQLESLGLEWTTPEALSTGDAMTAAFRLNLTVLSLIALLVSLYLITQALDAAVVRRRSEIGILRALGLTPAMVQKAWIAELLILGALGGIGGLLLGWALAQFTAGAVAQTVNALYFGVNAPSPVRPGLSDLLLALFLGLGGSWVAGWLPLRDAGATPPAQILSAGNFSPGFGIFRRHRLGAGLILLGILGWLLPPLVLEGGGRFPLAGYATAFLWLLGGTLLLSVCFRAVACILRLGDPFWPAVRLARARLSQPSSRHRLAAAGLFVALAMAAAMSILVGSFEKTLTRWIAVRFQADIYISSVGRQSATADATIRPELCEAIEAHPEVTHLERRLSLPLELRERRTFIEGIPFAGLSKQDSILWRRAPTSPPGNQTAYINEAFAERFQISLGEKIELETPFAGAVALQIEGIFSDYGNEQGTLLVDINQLAFWWGREDATSLNLDLAPGVDPALWAEERATEFPGLDIRDNVSLHAAILKVFRQTFAVTEALKYIGIFVALAGLALAQYNLLRESRDELHAMRCLGATQHTIGSATAFECLGTAAVGLLGGLLLSLGLGALLIFVINKQSFGWTLQFSLPLGELLTLGGLTLAASAGVGYGVGRSVGSLQKPS